MEQIMNQTDVKVSFYLKKSEADAKGNCPVMARLIVGKYSETAFSVKLRVPQSLWLSGRACGKSAAARDINNRLDEIRAAAFSIYAEQSANREVVTAEEVKHQLLGMASEQETLLSYFRLFMRNFEKRVGINRTESSLNGYRNSYDHLVRFLQSQYKLSDIPFAALDRSFIEKFDLHLRTECHLAPGTIVNLTVRLKTIVGLAKDGKHRTSELLYGFPPQTIGLKQNTPLFRLLTQIQDEVHRFAITFHREKRSKRQIASELDEIKGIGEKTKAALLKEFKSVKRIKEASLEALTKVIGEAKAKVIEEYFRS